LPQTYAPAKLLIETGVITEAKFPKKIADELATCRKAHRDSFRREGVGLAAQGDRGYRTSHNSMKYWPARCGKASMEKQHE
jgi:hypothetical protein